MSFEKTLEEKLGRENARKLIQEIRKGAGKSDEDLKIHIDKALKDFGITDTDLSATIATQVKPR